MKVHDDFARPPLASDRVRFVGEAVAVVFAESLQLAVDAAAAVLVDIDPLTVYIDAEQALADDAEPLFPAHGSNLAMAESSDPPLDLESISDVVVRGRYVNQRVAVAPMEPHCFAAAPGDDGRLTVWPSNQFPHHVHELSWPPPPGSRSSRSTSSRRRSAAGSAARPGCSTSTRWSPWPPIASAVRSCGCRRAPRTCRRCRTAAARSSTPSSAAAPTARSPACGCAWSATVAPIPTVGAFLPGGTRRMSHGTYAFPAIEFDVAVAATNTGPMGAYRGAGRPEATALLERLVDQARTSSGSTRSSCASATCSPTTCSRSPR